MRGSRNKSSRPSAGSQRLLSPAERRLTLGNPSLNASLPSIRSTRLNRSRPATPAITPEATPPASLSSSTASSSSPSSSWSSSGASQRGGAGDSTSMLNAAEIELAAMSLLDATLEENVFDLTLEDRAMLRRSSSEPMINSWDFIPFCHSATRPSRSSKKSKDKDRDKDKDKDRDRDKRKRRRRSRSKGKYIDDMATIHSSSTGSSNKATATASAAATTATASPSILVEFVEKRTHVSRSKARVSAVARPLSKQHSIGDELAVPRDHDDDEDRPGSARGTAAAAASAAASASVSVADHSIHGHGGSHSASLLGFSSPASPASSTTSASTPVLSTRPRSRSVSSPKTNYDSGSESDDDDEDDDDDEERGSTGRKTDAERKKGAIPAYLRLSHPRMLQSHQHSPVKEIVESFVQQQLDMEKRWIDFSSFENKIDTPREDLLCWTTRDDVIAEMRIAENEPCTVDKDICSGTLLGLVSAMANEAQQDVNLISSFLHTYRYFTSDLGLLCRLITRYFVRVPTDAPAAVTKWLSKWKGPIRMRVINLFKKWIEGFFVLLDENEVVISQLQAFISSIVLPRYTAWGQMILGMIAEKQQEKAEQAHMKRCLKVPLNVMVDYIIRKNRLQQRKSNSGHKTIPGGLAVVWLSEGFELEEPDAVYALRIAVDIGHLTRDEQYPIEQMFKGNLHIAHSEAPKPQLSEKQKSELNLDYMEVPALEIARQLTLIEQDLLFELIPSRDLVNVASGAKTQALANLIDWTNRLSGWIVSEIVQTPNERNRIAIVKRFIQIAEECLHLKNYNSLAAIVWSLGHIAIKRLKRTWAGVPKKSLKTLSELEQLTSVLHNFGNLRAKIETESPPFIPNFALFLKDIALTEAGNPTTIEQNGTKLINFDKFKTISRIYARVEQLQTMPYNLKRLYAIYSWLARVKGLSDEEVERQSLALENFYSTYERD